MSKPIRPDKLEKMIKELLQAKDIEENHEEMAPVQATENGFPFIEGVNWDIAMEHLMDKELVIETIGDFYSTMTAEKEYLRQCYEGIDNEEGLKNYRVKVHSMKSSLALIGIMKLSEKAKALEMAAANEDRDYIRKNTDSFLTEWDIYKERLSILIPKEVDKVKADYAEVKVMLNNLKTAMEEMDIDMSDDIMKSLKAYNYKQEIAEKIELLATAVVNLDVESATEIIIEVIERIETDA
jgi:HPt (histidine-containing phosphotransfer) domain-containing protein